MNEMRTETVREQLAMKARARDILQKLINYFAFTGSIGEHFKGETILEVKGKHSAQEIAAYVNNRLQTMPQIVHDDFEGKRALALLSHRILRVLAEGKIVPNEELETLTVIMNGFIMENPIIWDSRSRTYHRFYIDFRPIFIENLLEYMTLSARYGPQHSICAREGCNTLMVAGRGAKKFCSPQCRKADWAYEGKKDYYRDHKKESRDNRKRTKKKGTIDGKTRK